MLNLEVKKKEIITDVLYYEGDLKRFTWVVYTYDGARQDHVIKIPEWVAKRIFEFYNNTIKIEGG